MMTHRTNLTPYGRRAALVVAFGILLGGSSMLTSGATRTGAAAFVAELYRYHFAHQQNWDVTRRRYSRRLSPRLSRALVGDDRLKAKADGDLIGLDYDPLTSAQEELGGYRIGAAFPDGTGTVVPVDLWYPGGAPGRHEHDVRVRVVKSRSGWLLDDVESFGTGLVQQLEADQKEESQ